MFKILTNLKSPYAREGPFVANVLTLMTGTTIAQAILIIISPILSRIYVPRDFGIFAIYTAVASVLSVISTGRYEHALMLPEKDMDAIHIATLSFILVFLLSFLTLLIVWIFNHSITEILGKPEISMWLYFIPLMVLLTGIFQTLNYWSNRIKQFKRLATSMVSKSIATALTNLGMGFGGFGVSGLIVGGIIGQGVGAGFLGFSVLRKDKEVKKQLSLKRIKSLFVEYIDYPKKSAVGALLNATSYQAEFIILTMLFNLASVGHFFFVNKIVNIPKLFVSSAIWQVFLGENSRRTKEQILNSLNHYQSTLFKMTTLPFYSSLFVASNLFVIIFGESWREAAVFLYPLIIGAHINLVVASFSLFTILNRPDADMTFNALLAMVKVLAIVLSFLLFKNILYSVVAIATVQFTLFLLLGSWNYKQLGKSSRYFSSMYLKQLLKITPYMAILAAINGFINNFPVLLTSVIALNVFHIKTMEI